MGKFHTVHRLQTTLSPAQEAIMFKCSGQHSKLRLSLIVVLQSRTASRVLIPQTGLHSTTLFHAWQT